LDIYPQNDNFQVVQKPIKPKRLKKLIALFVVLLPYIIPTFVTCITKFKNNNGNFFFIVEIISGTYLRMNFILFVLFYRELCLLVNKRCEDIKSYLTKLRDQLNHVLDDKKQMQVPHQILEKRQKYVSNVIHLNIITISIKHVFIKVDQINSMFMHFISTLFILFILCISNNIYSLLYITEGNIYDNNNINVYPLWKVIYNTILVLITFIFVILAVIKPYRTQKICAQLLSEYVIRLDENNILSQEFRDSVSNF